MESLIKHFKASTSGLLHPLEKPIVRLKHPKGEWCFNGQ
jgi:hypothetical protein